MISSRQAQRAVALHGERLSAYPNVVGIGVVPVEPGRHQPEGHALGVYVSRKVGTDLLDDKEVLPGYVEIPAKEGSHKVEVKVIEIGELEAQQDDAGPPASWER